mmetsp:Transcript_49423/g.114542  ORF Transcript_49423/g.114542 Transcript_49423/m.114542 type:complete len:311 (+) Transcript_49423:437-1369(+)
MLLVDLQDDGENRLLPRLGLLRLLHLLHVCRELVEEMVDDVGSHDLHVIVRSLQLGLVVDLHIEAKDDSVLRLLLLFHDGRLLYILLVHLTYADVKDRDLHVTQEAQQRFQSAQGARLHIHTLGLFLEIVEDALEAFGDLLLQLLDIVIRSNNKQLRPSDGLFETGSADLDAHGHADLWVMDVLTLDPHLLHGLWCQQCADSRHNGPGHAGEHDLITLTKGTIDQYHVDRCAKTFYVFHLNDCALEVLLHLQPVCHERLREIQQVEKQVRYTLAGQCARGADGHDGARVLILPVEGDVQAMLVQLQHDIA